jgi:uncharacterized NAD(P)/FAD-binding protein YdhS
MSMPHQFQQRVIIIGGGASGVFLACHLLRDRATSLHVTIIEKRPQVGRGIAYATANPEHLLNVRAANMSAFPDDPDHFWRWLAVRRNRPNSGAAIPNCADPFCFAPRQIYGDYIAELVEPLLASDERGPGLHILQGECVSVSETHSGVAVALANGERLTADMAVLATGHEPPAPCRDYQADPWTSPAEAGIAQDDRVLIIGTGLTMVDYVLALILSGHRGPIVAMSRRGLLPRAHRPIEPFPIEERDVPFGAGLTDLLRWVRICVRSHTARGGDWRSVIDGLRPFNQRIWQGLSIDNRRRFQSHARAWWDVHRHRMAPEVEIRLNAIMASGQLRVVAAKLLAVEAGLSGASVNYRRRGDSTIEALHFDKIVECRGVVPVPANTSNPALRTVLEKGHARLDPLCIGLDVTPDCSLIDRRGIASQRLYAVGPLTRAEFWEIVAVPDIRTQCARLAAHLTARLSTSAEPQPGLSRANA